MPGPRAGMASRERTRAVDRTVDRDGSMAKRSETKSDSRRVSGVASKIRPVGDRVVVKPAAKEEVTRSGIVIPDTAKEKPQEGTVIAVGSGRLLENGDRAAIELREGDRVLFAKYGGTEFKLDGEEYLVLKENDILAVVG